MKLHIPSADANLIQLTTDDIRQVEICAQRFHKVAFAYAAANPSRVRFSGSPSVHTTSSSMRMPP